MKASLRWPRIVNRADPVLGITHKGFLLNVDEAFTCGGGTGCTHTGRGNIVKQSSLDIQRTVEGAGGEVPWNRDAPRGIIPGEVCLQRTNLVTYQR